MSSFVQYVAGNSELLIGLCVIMGIMQVLYWIGSWTRDWWHTFLRRVGLRSARLDA